MSLTVLLQLVLVVSGLKTEHLTNPLGIDNPAPRFSWHSPAFCMDIRITYEDGTEQIVSTGPGWQTSSDGPLLYNNIYTGEHYDTRREQKGWAEPGYDERDWVGATLRSCPAALITTQQAVRINSDVPEVSSLQSSSSTVNDIYAGGMQTDQSLPLSFGLVPEEYKDAVLKALVKRVEEDSSHVNAGVHGAKAALNVLAANGYGELAYKMATAQDFPSWGWWLANGRTTLVENWSLDVTRDNSDNHIMFGDIAAWFHRALGLLGEQSIRDLWRRQDVGKVADKERWEVKLPAHGCALYRLSPGVTPRKMEGKWWEIR